MRLKVNDVSNKQQKGTWLGLGALIIGLGLMAVLLAAPGTEAQGPSPPTATPNSPPPANPGGGDSNENSDDDDSSSSSPAGAYIELQAENAPAGAWSVVQWQDSNADWQNVEGWRGKLDNGTRRWWVHPKDFDTGPFRWVVYESPGGRLLATSESFSLPQFPNETVRVEAINSADNR
jgi:hypothetical protein